MLGLVLEPQSHSIDLALGALRLVLARPRANCRLHTHTHDLPHLSIVFRGRVVDMRGDRDHLVHAGEVGLHPPGIVHQNAIVGPDPTLLAIDLPREHAIAVAAIFGDVEENVLFSFQDLRNVPEQIREETLLGDDASARIIPALVEQMIALCARVVARRRGLPEWLLLAEAIVQRRYRERWTIGEIALNVGVSASRLTHGFRDLLGRPFGDVLREIRIAAAAHALAQSEETIGEIADECGFADQAHLTRVFRCAKGCTPLEYRRRVRANAR